MDSNDRSSSVDLTARGIDRSCLQGVLRTTWHDCTIRINGGHLQLPGVLWPKGPMSSVLVGTVVASCSVVLLALDWLRLHAEVSCGPLVFACLGRGSLFVPA